jgi:hypothetical protein
MLKAMKTGIEIEKSGDGLYTDADSKEFIRGQNIL